ncbi:calcium-binding mitochondrial carrier protein [Physcia stellaris]|nr:calcium-binding mitochondrial carrier protein [Physcia stellaris]
MPSTQVIYFAKLISSESLWRRLLNKLPLTNDLPSTLAWSLSFYPQCILNYRRRSTQGTTPAFLTINVLGFIAYLISTVALYASPLIRAQYAARNPLSPEPTVRLNDVAYGVHAVVMSIVGLTMFSKTLWGFKQGKERVGTSIWGIAVGCIVAVFWIIGLVLVKSRDVGRDPLGWAWLDVLVATVVKYIPQAYTNYRNQSTDGWCIEPILLDVIGGILSLVQLVIDSSLQNDWSGITGNPIKLGLGNITLFFDIIFMCQHYIFYRHRTKPLGNGLDGEQQPLLAGDAQIVTQK